MYDNDYALIDPSQFIIGSDRYKKQSHELRVSSPVREPLAPDGGRVHAEARDTASARRTRSTNLIDIFEVPGNPDTLWLTDQERTDNDDAVFGELTFDITDKLSVTGGVRFFETENSLKGFFGFGAVFSSGDRRIAVLRPDRFPHARPAPISTRRSRKTATPSASTSPATPPTT